MNSVWSLFYAARPKKRLDWHFFVLSQNRNSFAELPLAKFLPASDLMHLCDIVLVPLIIPCFNNIVLLMFTVHLTGIY